MTTIITVQLELDNKPVRKCFHPRPNVSTGWDKKGKLCTVIDISKVRQMS